MELENTSIIIGLILLFFSIQDIRKKTLSSGFLLVFAIFAVIMSIFKGDVAWIERIFGILTGLFFLFLSKVTRGQIGMGDGMLLGITGFMLGFWQNIWMICFGFFLVAIFSIFLLILCWENRKKNLPFVPFLFLSYTGMYLMGIFTIVS